METYKERKMESIGLAVPTVWRRGQRQSTGELRDALWLHVVHQIQEVRFRGSTEVILVSE